MIQFIKRCLYWFMGLFTNKFKNIPKENTNINKLENKLENNLENNNINIVSVKVRYVKEKEN